MSRSQSLKCIGKLRQPRAGLAGGFVLFLSLLLAVATAAFAQSAPDFTLQAAAFSPNAVDPGGTSGSNIILNPVNGFSGSVTLSCSVSPATAITPACLMSPGSVAPPAGAAATIIAETNAGRATPGLYTVTFTGTSTVNGSQVTHTAQQSLTILAVTPQFTITVISAISPTSVHAGSGASGKLQVTPINGYSGTVTLACSSVTPLVTVPPQCAFSPPAVKVSGVPQISQISISTVGPTTVIPPTALIFPLLATLGMGALGAGKRSRRIWGLFGLLLVAASVLVVPACTNHIPLIQNNPNLITPKDTYVFTLSGIDENGNTSSNAGSATSPTVTLTLD
jgi:hypothetical protein